MTAHRPDPAEDRRRLFRRMELVFVWIPPLLALGVGLLGGAFLAWLLPVGSATFVARWILASTLLLGGTGLLYAVTQWWGRRK